MFSRLPLLRLSTTRTRAPRSTSASTRWEPMNDAPPVTSTRLPFQSIRGISLCSFNDSFRERCVLLLQRHRPHDERVHLRPEEAVKRFGGSMHDWLALVEGRVEKDGHARLLLEGFQQLPVERIRGAAHGLQSA